MHCVLTAVGTDRPGLVQDVSEFVLAHGGSIHNSRMVNLRGQFAIAMLVAGAEATSAAIESDLERLRSAAGIQAQVARVEEISKRKPTVLYRLTGRTLDQLGLVHVVANALRALDVNIESMETAIEPAPITGTPTFTMDIVIAVPENVPRSHLREELDRVCNSLNVDWTLTDFQASEKTTHLSDSRLSSTAYPNHGWGPSR